MRPSAGVWVAIAAVLLVNGAFVLNNLAPYFGLNYAGAMTMYSGLAADGEDHFFMPKVPLGDADAYVWVIRAAAREAPTSAAEQFGQFAEWARQRRRLVSLNFVHYHTSRVCRSAPGARLELTLQTPGQQRLTFQDACAEPTLLRYSVLSKYPPCQPECKDVLKLWVQGKVPTR